ncbi:SagB family peptide dehydrogenase [Nocardia brevicatena]|uniref:SagB family peptide dehydrogenase n=1 Tax=Nocardia brevicatena TaxID=37327 RepID=UPI0002F8F4AC|nr:SagB family peptide dehydrogenase [Nocardia brevicatena]
MSTATRHQRLRYALRPGVTCLTVPNGAVLLNPPHSRRLTGLSATRLTALKILNRGPSTLDELAGDPAVVELMGELTADGWLAVTVLDGDHELYTVTPFSTPPAPPTGSAPSPGALSKFAVLHREAGGFVLEHPLSWCDIHIHDPRVLALLGGQEPNETTLPDDLVARLAADLHRGGFTVIADEDQRFATRSWNTADLWFHRRSTLGDRVVNWEHFGPTKWAKSRFPQPPARKPAYPGEPVALHTPDLAALRHGDRSFTAVLEDRVSTRAFDDAHPITAEQLGELLYRTARTRETRSPAPGEELVSRPYPSGGSVYELELYPVVRNIAGLAPGMYHYDSFDHVLRPVADAESVAVRKLIKSTSATLTEGAEPQVLIIMAARSGRVMWTYERVAYAVILKHVGVLMQTMYLTATAMGLGACAQGFGDTAAFVAAANVHELEECSVGSIIIGSPTR